MDIGGLGSQAEADRKKAEREETNAQIFGEEERGKQERHRRRVEQLLEGQAKDQAQILDALFRQGELTERLLNEMLKNREGKQKGAEVKFQWHTRMNEQEKLDREVLWIPLTMREVPRSLVEAQYKMLVKHVHPDLNPEIGNEPFVVLKAARDRMLKRCLKR